MGSDRQSTVPVVPAIGLEGLLTRGSGETPSELGRILEEFRPYLLAIANLEFPPSLAGKLSPSDLVQVTIAKGFCHVEEFRGRTSNELASWLRQILLNQLKSEKRSYCCEKRNVSREQASDSKLTNPNQRSPSGEVLSLEEQELLTAGLQRLPDVYQRAIEMRHIQNLSFAEMGQQLARSEDAARKLWSRAVKQLQLELGIDDSRRLFDERGRS